MTEAYWRDSTCTLLLGDALDVLREMPSLSVDCCVTSPPYFGLRDYGTDGQYGLEDSPAEYVENLRSVFAEVLRVLAPDGTLWLNLGDSYYSGRGNPGPNADDRRQPARRGWTRQLDQPGMEWGTRKSLVLIPERIILALFSDGWVVRNKGVWHKPNAMPSNAGDRLEGKWEPFYLLTRSRDYWFGDAPAQGDVWRIPVAPHAGAHFATFPLTFPVRCITAGCKPGGVVLDPFSGSGTTGQAARITGHPYVGIDLSAAYHDMAIKRYAQGVLDLETSEAAS
jgi:DNA modification methylase